MRGRFSVWVVAVLGLGLLLLPACGDDDSSESGSATTAEGSAQEKGNSQERGGVLSIGIDIRDNLGNHLSMDPIAAKRPQDGQYMQKDVYDTLLRKDEEGQLVPNLLSDWEVIDDSTLRLVIREGITFHDGTPFDADAVKFGLERNRDTENQIPFHPDLQSMERIEVTGPLEVTIAFSSPIANGFTQHLATQYTMIVSPAAAEAGTLNDHPVGAGPFEFVSLEPEALVSLRRFDGYWNEEAYNFEGIDYVHVVSGPPRVAILEAGQVDLVELTAIEAPGLLENPAYDHVTVLDSWLSMSLCKSAEPISDVRVRQALSHAINRETLNQALFSGLGRPMWGMWPEESPYYDPALDDYYEYDPERARELLADAGFPDGVTIEAVYTGPQELSRRTAEAVQAQLSEVGVDLAVRPSEDIVTEFFTNVDVPIGIHSSSNPDDQRVNQFHIPGNFTNVCDYNNPELIQMMEELSTLEPGSSEAVELWSDVQTLILDEVLSLYLLWNPDFHIFSSEIEGLRTFDTGLGLDSSQAVVPR